MGRVKRWGIGITCLMGLAACGKGESFLEGSLSDSFDLSFDTVRVRLYPTELSVEYVSGSGTSEKVALRAIVAVPSSPLATGTSYNLKTVTRVGYDAALPAIDSGTLQLSTYTGAADSDIKGSFDAVFTMPDSSKKTLRGGFSAALDVVSN
jgi:hypothetical protein